MCILTSDSVYGRALDSFIAMRVRPWPRNCVRPWPRSCVLPWSWMDIARTIDDVSGEVEDCVLGSDAAVAELEATLSAPRSRDPQE